MKKPVTSQKGFTLIELVVVLVILGLLAAVAVPKFLDLQKQAEVASVQGILGNLRSALTLRSARGLANGEDIATLAAGGSNELLIMQELLSNRPETYLGPTGNSAEKGAWFDDTDTNDLVYILKNNDIVSASQSQDGVEKLRFQVVAIEEDTNGDGIDETVGLSITSRVPGSFDWLY